jgi:uncharacterized protein YbcV (DUF1398 family)
MFTIDQIKAAHAKVKSGADFPRYVQDLIALGVVRYETFVTDGHTVFESASGEKITSEPKYDALPISEYSNATQFMSDLKHHQQGGTNYPTFCSDSARSGVEKWVVDMNRMTCTYLDLAGDEMLVEQIPVAAG